MKVGVNLLNFSQDRFGGVEQYVKHIVHHLADQEDITLYLFLQRPYPDVFPASHKRIKRVMFKQADTHHIIAAIRQYQLDLWFCPLHRSYISQIPIPTVVTIHDVLHTAYPQFVTGDLEHENYYKQFSPSFDEVITVSHFSKEAIATHLSIPVDRIHVIYQDATMPYQGTISKKRAQKIIKKYNLPDGYALFPASFNPHKNHLNLLKAILFIREHDKTILPLVLNGFSYKGSETTQSVLSMIQDHRLENQVKLLGYIPARDMPYIYANASFLIFPSLYEGFGIPLVEAMKSGCPIASSDRGSIPEIIGDAGLYFNPEDPKEMASQMLKLTEPQTRSRLILKGKERAARFSWVKSAEETLRVFQNALKRGKNV
ncbi:MAG: glycosyltransferase family 4 protein [Tuberibacillus sp.]